MLEAALFKYKQFPVLRLFQFGPTIIRWRRNSRTRRVLCEMDDWQLNDIGVARKAANAEVEKAFWQLISAKLNPA